MILKQDKRRGVAILDTAKYNKKIWHFKHKTFQRVTTYPTATTRKKLQKVLRKLKSKFSEQ